MIFGLPLSELATRDGGGEEFGILLLVAQEDGVVDREAIKGTVGVKVDGADWDPFFGTRRDVCCCWHWSGDA